MIKEREYLFSVDNYNKPVVYNKKQAIGLLLVRLILLEPGSDPLHPDMGVGIKNYRYTMYTLEELRKRVEDQINTYLPCFKASNVSIIQTPDHVCNIEITIDDTVYVYDSKEAPVSIELQDITY